MSQIVLATVYCKLCRAERRKQSERLGEVVKIDGVRVNWHGTDRDRSFVRQRREWEAETPDASGVDWMLRNAVTLSWSVRGFAGTPDEVVVVCKHHSRRAIPGAKLLAAKGDAYL